jgi:cell division protein FtsA
MDAAEVLKKKYGYAMTSLADPMETIEVPSVGGRPPRTLQRQELAQIIQPRMREILELVDHELVKSGQKKYLAGGVVLTGGGALLQGTVQLAEAVLNLGVCRGTIKNIVGITDQLSSPDYATAAGLLIHGSKDKKGDQKIKRAKHQKGNWIRRIKTWLEENL